MESEEISFGRFRLDLGRRELRRDGQPVRMHRRALGILCALAEAKGEIVSKDELMARLWPGRIVEEGNLHVHVSALRKSLDEHGEGHSLVVTVPGRGYRLADLTGLRSAQLAEGSSPPQLPLPDKPSIAVMPFQNLSGDPDQEYFADGMVEEIITALSPHPLAVRDRPQFELHLQGPRRRSETNRARTGRALRARRLGQEGRRPGADRRAADRSGELAHICGPTTLTVRLKTFSICRTKWRSVSLGSSSQHCGPRKSGERWNGRGPIRQLTIFIYARFGQPARGRSRIIWRRWIG